MLPRKHLVLGLLIREVLAPFTGHPYDFEIWARLGVYMQNLGNPYTVLPYYQGVSFAPQALTGSISYPPLPAFIFALTYRVYLVLGEPSRYLYYFLLKQPMVLSDIGVAILIARITVLNRGPVAARMAFIVWLYLPLTILVSSVWGALDPVALFLTMLAAYYLLNSKLTASACSLGFAIFLKTMPIVALPVFLVQLGSPLNRRIQYSAVSLGIPAFGTLAPLFLLKWGVGGIFANFSFQVDIPSTGAMSLLGQTLNISGFSGVAGLLAGALWIPILLLSYRWINKKQLDVLQAVLVSFLVFSLSRPFLPEQWALYPTAFLLTMIDGNNLRHFLGLSITATMFLVANNTWLVRFLSPVSTYFYSWDIYTNNLSPYAPLRMIVLLITSSLFFAEGLLTILGRESIIYRAFETLSANLSIRTPIVLRSLAER